MNLAVKDSMINEFKKQIVDHLLKSIKGEQIIGDIEHAPKSIVENDDSSPQKILIKGTSNQYLIYYPKHSARYIDKLTGLRKRCEVLMGEIHEDRCNKTFTPEDGEFIVPSNEEYQPYTTNNICIAKIVLEIDNS